MSSDRDHRREAAAAFCNISPQAHCSPPAADSAFAETLLPRPSCPIR